MGVTYNELPFRDRPDLTPYLIHLTKNTEKDDEYSAYDNLISILKTGKIWGSNNRGFVKGKGNTATCFMDIPFSSLKYVLNEENSSPSHPRYEPYGIFVEKNFAYKEGVRPVLYLSDQEVINLNIPNQELWRVVKLEVHNRDWVSWVHEREWRCKGNFQLPCKKDSKRIRPFKLGVLVKTYKDVLKLQKEMNEHPDDFNIEISTILPLDIICQGLYI